jgi:hypothetical protein
VQGKEVLPGRHGSVALSAAGFGARDVRRTEQLDEAVKRRAGVGFDDEATIEIRGDVRRLEDRTRLDACIDPGGCERF